MKQQAASPHNPFGTTITTDDIVDTISFFDTWEERYKYIIDLGKELPAMNTSDKTEENIVKGCQSQVWITHQVKGDRFQFEVDSDAFIVKGLLAVVLAAFNNKTAIQVREFDIEAYFAKLGLIKHLSPTRGNGMKAMVNKIHAVVA